MSASRKSKGRLRRNAAVGTSEDGGHVQAWRASRTSVSGREQAGKAPGIDAET